MKKLACVLAITAIFVAGAPATAGADTGVNQRFRIVKFGADPGVAVATGLIRGVGSVQTNQLAVPPGSPFQGVFTFRQGTMYETTTPSGPPAVEFNAAACLTRITLHATFVITGGTDELAGISGSGDVVAHITRIAGREPDGSCSAPAKPLLLDVARVTLTASVELP